MSSSPSLFLAGRAAARRRRAGAARRLTQYQCHSINFQLTAVTMLVAHWLFLFSSFCASFFMPKTPYDGDPCCPPSAHLTRRQHPREITGGVCSIPTQRWVKSARAHTYTCCFQQVIALVSWVASPLARAVSQNIGAHLLRSQVDSRRTFVQPS